MASLLIRQFRLFRLLRESSQQSQQTWRRRIALSVSCHNDIKNELMKEEVEAKANELVASKAKDLLEKEFPDHFRDGQFVSRMSYVEFIDEALARLKELGLDKDINAYKELLRVFPPGKYFPPEKTVSGLFYAPQQLAALRVLHQMEMSMLRYDKDFEKIVRAAFSNRSDIWLKVIRGNYWSMKKRNMDPNPLPDTLPKEPHQLAKLAIARMLDDRKSVITVANTSKLPDSVDKTWVVYSQSPTQKGIIDKLDTKSTLYIEEGGMTYVGDNYLAYYQLRYYVDDRTKARKETMQDLKPDFNYNTCKVQFFGKPIKEKYELLDDAHYLDGGYILSTVITGSSSQDSLLSWLKLLQQRNPKLAKLNVVFNNTRKPPEMIEYKKEQEEPRTEEEEILFRRKQQRQSANMWVK